MKKSLIAMAALAATSVFAQSSVTLYGIVEATSDIGYSSVTNVTATNAAGVVTATTRSETKNNFRIQDGNDQGTGTSRIGFRGTEDLGGGLKANFLLEMGLRVDDGAAPGVTGVNSGASGGNLFGRNAWGGLSGSFGEVRVGRQVLGSFSVQGNSGASGASNGLYDASTATLLPMGGVRFSNAVRYLSPNFSGLTASVMVSAPETGAATSTSGSASPTTGASRRTGVDLALEYANGPAYVGFGYNERDTANVLSSVAVIGLNTQTAALTPGKVKAYTLGGSYDLGVVKPYINYTRQKSDVNGFLTNTAPADSLSFTEPTTSKAFSIGLRAPVGAFTVIAGIGRLKATTDGLASSTSGGVTTTSTFKVEDKRTAFQLGAQYALSKRTLVEANYGQNKLDSSDVDAGGTVRTDNKVKAFNVGLKHSF